LGCHFKVWVAILGCHLIFNHKKGEYMDDLNIKIKFPDGISTWGVEDLIPYENNPRTHSQEQLQQLVSSMIEFGLQRPHKQLPFSFCVDEWMLVRWSVELQDVESAVLMYHASVSE
jgi:hypothetical protein